MVTAPPSPSAPIVYLIARTDVHDAQCEVERVETIANPDTMRRLAISREGGFERRDFGSADIKARRHGRRDGGGDLGLEFACCRQIEEPDGYDAAGLPVAAMKAG